MVTTKDGEGMGDVERMLLEGFPTLEGADVDTIRQGMRDGRSSVVIQGYWVPLLIAPFDPWTGTINLEETETRSAFPEG